MRYYLHLFSSFCLCVLLLSETSCGNKDALLNQAESLIEEHPDSVLTLLHQIKNPHQNLSERNYAFYSLLMTQAMDKCNMDLSEDTLMDIAVRYFTQTTDSIRAAKACFYAGKVSQQLRNPEQAIEFYLEAKDYLSNSTEYKYQFMVRNGLGTEYSDQWLYKDQLEAYREACHYAILKNDSLYLCVALENMGFAFSGLQKEDSAIVYQYKALQMAKACYPAAALGIYHHISGIYKRKQDYAKAIQYADSALLFAMDKSGLYFTKGDIYNKMHQYDSAFCYLTKSLLSDNIYTKASTCDALAEVYQALRKSDSAYSYMRLYNAFRDSIEDQTHTTAVVELENLYHHSKLKEENHLLKESAITKSRFIYIVLFIVSILLFIIGVLYAFFYNRKQRQIYDAQHLVRQKEIEKLQAETEFISLEKKLVELREAFYRQMNSIVVPKLHSLMCPNKSDNKSRIKISEEEWGFLVENTNIAFADFTLRLLKAYPLLDVEDIRLCCLIKMQLKLSDIADIYCVEKTTINKRRERIRKNKMGINDGRTLNDILKSF